MNFITFTVIDMNNKFCFFCGEDDSTILRKMEKHHPFGRKFSPETVWACPNCHAKITYFQNKAPLSIKKATAGKEKRLYAIWSGYSSIKVWQDNLGKLLEELMANEK